MHRHQSILHTGIFISCLLILSVIIVPQSLAARYSIEQLPSNFKFEGMNNVGTIVGLNENDTPFVWRINADSNTYIDTDRTLLPTTDLTDLATINVTAINNEQTPGTGGDIIGWYSNSVGDVLSVLWYQEKTTLETYAYKLTILPNLEEKARFCKSEPGENYPIPECIIPGFDDPLIQQSRECKDKNSNWETEGVFWTIPCATNSLPICEYRMTKTRTLDEEVPSQNDPLGFKYNYDANPEYLAHQCILREHAQIAMRASECPTVDGGWVDNSKSETDDIIPTIVTCDTQSKALGINNDNTIVGVSYDKNNKSHPVAWIPNGSNVNDDTPTFLTVNLGLERVDATPEHIKKENLEKTEFAAEKSPSYKMNRRSGEAQLASAATGDIAGILKPDDSTPLRAYYWPKVDGGGFDLPVEILSPLKDSEGNYRSFETLPVLTSVSSRLITGYFSDDSNIDRAAQWLYAPGRDENNEVIDVLIPQLETMLESGEKGKILHGNSVAEVVGTAVVTNSENFTEDHAFYTSPQSYRRLRCGVQDLNQLLAEAGNGTLRLTEAYKIASGQFPNAIIAKGINPTTSDPANDYLLTPEDVYVNLKVDISSDQERLTVGDEHAYFLTLSNNSAPYATCVAFTFEASVYDPQPDSELPKKELLAGLTFLSVESQADIECLVTTIDVTCRIDQLDSAAPVTVKINTSPRPLLADRRIKTTARIFSTELELPETQDDNSAFVITSVDRRGCFIATAAYGSYLSPEVKGLRIFRDEVLLKTEAGRWLVDTYYDISPPYADYIGQSEDLRMLSRWILSPLVYLVLYPLQTISGLILLIFVSFRIRSKYFQELN